MSENRDYDWSERRWERRHHRRSFFWPVILITAGVVFLLRNAGLLTGDVWDTILRLWPILLVAIGLDSLFQRSGVAGPVFWITLGGVLLLANLDLIDVNVWQLLLSLWPVLLIAIGLDIAIGRRSAAGALVALVLLVAVVAGAIFFLASDMAPGMSAGGEPVLYALDGASQANVELEPAAGAVFIGSLSGGDQLVQGNVRLGVRENLAPDYSVQGGSARLSIGTEVAAVFYPSRLGSDWNWVLHFNPDVLINMVVSMGVGELNMDLRGLNLSYLEASLGLGRLTVVLPEQNRLDLVIDGAVGETVIVVPQGTQVRITADTGLAFRDIPDTYQRQDDVYTSPGYSTAGDQAAVIDLAVSQAIGRLVVREE